MGLIIALVLFALVVGLLLQLPMLAEFRQVIIIVALILMIVYVAQYFGVFGSVHHL